MPSTGPTLPTLALLACAVLSHAAPESGKASRAEALFRRVLASQGKLPEEGLRTVRLTFTGQIQEQETIQSVRVTYVYRKDGSFSVKKSSKADAAISSERGMDAIEGKTSFRFWELVEGEKRRLKKLNQNDAKVIAGIRKERSDFKRILDLVFLARTRKEGTRYELPGAKVKLHRDRPRVESDVFRGVDREADAFIPLDILPPDHPRIRLFVHARTAQIHKAIVFRTQKPVQPRGFYYFGRFRERDGLNLPRIVSFHREDPRDAETRDRSALAWGQVTVRINEAKAKKPE